MKLKKEKKSRRLRGSRYHGKAAKKHKGKGNVGGKGMAGTGKRADQKKTFILKYMWPYFGGEGLKKKKAGKKGNQINLGDIEKNIENLIRNGKAKKTKQGIEVKFENYKVLGGGKLKEKLIIKAAEFSKKAEEKIEKIGGRAMLLGKVRENGN
jgi:large subunit ribosomal protein L15